MSRCYVYVLKEPRSGAIRYVGITRSPTRRYLQHTQPGKHRTGRWVKNWIRWLQKRGKEPVMEIKADFPDRDQARLMEMLLIQELRRCGCKLTNGSDGGE